MNKNRLALLTLVIILMLLGYTGYRIVVEVNNGLTTLVSAMETSAYDKPTQKPQDQINEVTMPFTPKPVTIEMTETKPTPTTSSAQYVGVDDLVANNSNYTAGCIAYRALGGRKMHTQGTLRLECHKPYFTKIERVEIAP